MALLGSSSDTNGVEDKLKKEEVRLIDIARGEALPSYANDGMNGTYLLFPVKGESVPLETVAHKIHRLVALDCKWTQPGLNQSRASLSKLPKVHLTNPPSQSQFWRWHNAGDGMLSTIEAIFYASLEVKIAQIEDEKQSTDMKNLQEENCSLESQDLDDKHNRAITSLLPILYLFGVQRAVAARDAIKSGRKIPWSNEAKLEQNLLRVCVGTEKHARDKKIGRVLKETNRSKPIMDLPKGDVSLRSAFEICSITDVK
eukprot:CAMPEP_0194387016 /NCGR_PEP_ID=MMETSP0174-20130528/89633_1 /TAXON_ID=216777 /ORGANISM="Proboscia alata, Strain PI-D3" /LENGTH=256 /DNA_ID=CAMNT_0039176731 /DNA_START=284 /DNA_END=1054 /DNA_ORIENTATION=+